MEQLVAASLVIASGLAGLALGLSGTTVVQVAPEAFERLDYQRADSMVRRLVKGGLPWISGFAIVGGVFASYGTLTGRDAGVALLILLAAMKLVEMRRPRDYYVAIFIGLFLLLTNFFYAQSILMALYTAATVIVFTIRTGNSPCPGQSRPSTFCDSIPSP